MSNLITVIGATGTQGGSVIRALLHHPEYSLRAVTRSAQSEAARALAALGVEVVTADLEDAASLRAAFAGSHAIFAVTNFFETVATLGIEGSMERETRMGVQLADAVAATPSLAHYVWSTLPDSRRNTHGAVAVPYYESKSRVDAYIRTHPTLRSKTTFLWLGWYASNMQYSMFRPNRVHAMPGLPPTYVQLISVPPSVPIPLLGDAQTNVGKFVRAILEQPEKTLPGRIVAGVDQVQTFHGLMEMYGAAQGITARSVQVPKEDYRQLWPVMGDLMDKTNSYFEFMDGKAFSSVDEEVLTKDDLQVEGLVGTAEAFTSER